VIGAVFVEVTTATASATRGLCVSVRDGMTAATGAETPAIAVSSATFTDAVRTSASAADPGRARTIGREKNTDEATAATANRARYHF
jgi:hypothetical protein